MVRREEELDLARNETVQEEQEDGAFAPDELFRVEAGTWWQVRARCIQGGGDLVSLHTPTQAALAGAVCTGQIDGQIDGQMTGASRCYIGLEREASGEEWVWTDETRANYLPWNVSRTGGGTKAVLLGAEGTGWHDEGAGWTTLPGVCLKTRGPSEPTPLFVVGAGTWDEVRARCRMGGGDLASLHTPRQAELARAVCGEPRCYIGLQRATPAAAWGWVDDSEANYLPWDRAEPARNGTKAVFVGAEG